MHGKIFTVTHKKLKIFTVTQWHATSLSIELWMTSIIDNIENEGIVKLSERDLWLTKKGLWKKTLSGAEGDFHLNS